MVAARLHHDAKDNLWMMADGKKIAKSVLAENAEP
jgi:hypothetical protein